MKKEREPPRTTRQKLVGDLKETGTTVTKIINSNTQHRRGLKSYNARKVLLPEKTHVQARPKFANKHLDDSEEGWEKILWLDETKIEFFGINSTRRIWGGKKAD